MAPEVIWPFALKGSVKVEVLQLCKGEEGGGFDDSNIVQSGKAFVVYVEGVLKSEAPMAVGKLCTAVINNEYLICGPAGSDVGNDGLLKQKPVAGERDHKRGVRSFEAWRQSVP